MAKTMTCPFCGRSFSWVGPAKYWDEYVCECGTDLWLEIVRRLDIDENGQQIQINSINR